MSDERWQRYAALVEPASSNPDGSDDVEAGILVDALPIEELGKLDTWARNGGSISDVDPIPFLALTLNRDAIEDLNEPRWVQLDIARDPTNRDRAIDASVGVFGDNRGDEIQSQNGFYVRTTTALLPNSDLSGLEILAEFQDVDDSTEEEIIELLERRAANAVAVSVYDVGQGSLSAVVNQNEHPLVFFDLGWPLQLNKKSFLKNTRFAPLGPSFCNQAPVVLSHLDWDHWGYAIESGLAKEDSKTGFWRTEPKYRAGAINRPWIMTRPQLKRHKLGPSHLHLIQTLAKNGTPSGNTNLRFWPHASTEITAGPLTVFRCSPSTTKGKKPSYLRNNESLGLLLSGDGARVLLCGDADYPSLPNIFKRRLTGMVAPHHGGATTPGQMPQPVGHGRMVLSTFETCYKSIPCKAVLEEASSSGWRIARTDDRYACGRCGEEHGNRLLRLTGTPRCGCGGVESSSLCVTRP